MILEEQRFLHEDLERLEQGISDRVAQEPRHVSSFLPSDDMGILMPLT
jgi:splicing factor 3A subunit 3